MASTSPSNLIKSKVMDYTMDLLTQDTGYRVHIAHKLADVSLVLEAKLGGPQVSREEDEGGDGTFFQSSCFCMRW